ncbi:hypothetical protein M513_00080 [Trichuris suis]|uniref:Uncharacterized protein n=1 Tax=Trichuris suis TaxID=68888 RepID=A0A085MNX1_9BILA|nr:hypothetical protein M513_00080 [Trichuris suis]
MFTRLLERWKLLVAVELLLALLVLIIGCFTQAKVAAMDEAVKASAIVEHASHCDGQLVPRVICQEQDFQLRKIKEALFIRHNEVINRDKAILIDKLGMLYYRLRHYARWLSAIHSSAKRTNGAIPFRYTSRIHQCSNAASQNVTSRLSEQSAAYELRSSICAMVVAH